MLVFTSRKFRANLKLALDKVLEGEKVMVVRKGQLFVVQIFEGEDHGE
jgi:hypothetical protein